MRPAKSDLKQFDDFFYLPPVLSLVDGSKRVPLAQIELAKELVLVEKRGAAVFHFLLNS
jgi:hypothetical protein